MNITSRYSDIPTVTIDPLKVPEKFRALLPLAREWCIGDDVELDAFIREASEERKRKFVEAFLPHFDGLWQWHEECAQLVPQPDELVLFDIAANAAATVQISLQ